MAATLARAAVLPKQLAALAEAAEEAAAELREEREDVALVADQRARAVQAQAAAVADALRSEHAELTSLRLHMEKHRVPKCKKCFGLWAARSCAR